MNHSRHESESHQRRKRGAGVVVPRPRRAAYAQPRVLAGCSLLILIATAYLAIGARSRSLLTAPEVTPATHTLVNWSNLGGLLARYGRRHKLSPAAQQKAIRAASRAGRGSAPRARSVVRYGGGGKLFMLTDIDLTPNSPSEEREPAVSPDGTLIAFASNGADSKGTGAIDSLNADGHFHLWVMNNNGSAQHQVTGLAADDKLRDQRTPSWSPNGNRIVYVDAASVSSSQLAIVDVTQKPATTVQFTSFNGIKVHPSWSPGGTVIAFSTNVDPNSNTNLNTFDIFTLPTTGQTISATRLTGGPSDPIGDGELDTNPAYSLVNPGVIYWASSRLNAGLRIWAMRSTDGTNKVQISDPGMRPGQILTANDDRPSPSQANAAGSNLGGSTGFDANGNPTYSEAVAFQSDCPIDNSDQTRDLNLWTVAVDTTSVTTPPVSTTPIETDQNGGSPAILQTSSVSSPATAGAAGVVEDVVADQDPGFGRATAGSASANQQIVFASQRTKDGAGNFQNPSGGPRGTNDIWMTATADTTAPVLLPFGSGNQKIPVVAPGPQAPFFAPRTAEQGLLPGGDLRIGVVFSEQQSGLNSVVATIRDASNQNASFQFYQERTDPSIPAPGITVAQETGRDTTNPLGSGHPAVRTGVQLTAYDDGPVSQGGHEQQANAVKGDGIYYCESTIKAVDDNGSPLSGDYYMDITASDNAGNSFTYDNIWGFSTQTFLKSTDLLFISDYTDGQEFPSLLSNALPQSGGGFGGQTVNSAVPTESYYLNSPGGDTLTVATAKGNVIYGVSPIHHDTFVPDVWRVQCRGAVGDDVLASYTPQTITQLDPTDIAGNFAKTISATKSTSGVIFGSPYTDGVVAGPGGLGDASEQLQLSRFVAAGGRLFVSGKNVIRALTDSGNHPNSFLTNVLHAGWAGETGSSPTALVPYVADAGVINTGRTLHTPEIHGFFPSYGDAAVNQGYTTPDRAYHGDLGKIALAAAPGVDIKTIYTYNNTTDIAATRISTVQSSGISSKVVFFSFGFEGIHREYSFDGTSAFCFNQRFHLAQNIRNYFETYTISGTVRDQTGQPIPNFLVEIFGNTVNNINYIARTDRNGFYQIEALPAGSYNVVPAESVDVNGNFTSLNGAYLPSTSLNEFVDITQPLAQNVNFSVNTIPPGDITGRAISDKGTELDLTDDHNPTILATNVPVLLRSVQTNLPPSPFFPGGGSYAVLITTGFDGKFDFPFSPANMPYQIIFNPTPGFVSQGGDIPNGSNIDYGGPTSKIQPNKNYDRRQLPTDNRYQGTFSGPNPITAPPRDFLDLGDIPLPPVGTLPPPATPTPTATPAPTATITPTPAPTATPGPTATPTATPAGTATPAPSATPVPTATFSPTATPAPTAGSTPTPVPGATPTSTPVPAATPTSTPVPGATPTPTSVGPTPTPLPGATPTPVPTPLPGPTPNVPPDYQPGLSYQISVPYMDGPGPGDSTLAEKAFSLPPTSPDGTVNFKLFKFNPLSQAYLPLDTGSVLTRGEGYFIRPSTQVITMNRPPVDPTRIGLTTAATEFPVVLRRDPSLAANDPHNGYNMVGFPFDPAIYNFVDWSASRVVMPDGKTQYTSLDMAVAAGVLSGTLSTQQDGSSVYVTTTTMKPFHGYFARTFVDGVTVYLKPSKSQ